MSGPLPAYIAEEIAALQGRGERNQRVATVKMLAILAAAAAGFVYFAARESASTVDIKTIARFGAWRVTKSATAELPCAVEASRDEMSIDILAEPGRPVSLLVMDGAAMARLASAGDGMAELPPGNAAVAIDGRTLAAGPHHGTPMVPLDVDGDTFWRSFRTGRILMVQIGDRQVALPLVGADETYGAFTACRATAQP